MSQTDTRPELGQRVYAHPNHRHCGQHIDCGAGVVYAVYDDGTCHVALDRDPVGRQAHKRVYATWTAENGGDPVSVLVEPA